MPSPPRLLQALFCPLSPPSPSSSSCLPTWVGGSLAKFNCDRRWTLFQDVGRHSYHLDAFLREHLHQYISAHMPTCFMSKCWASISLSSSSMLSLSFNQKITYFTCPCQPACQSAWWAIAGPACHSPAQVSWFNFLTTNSHIFLNLSDLVIKDRNSWSTCSSLMLSASNFLFSRANLSFPFKTFVLALKISKTIGHQKEYKILKLDEYVNNEPKTICFLQSALV